MYIILFCILTHKALSGLIKIVPSLYGLFFAQTEIFLEQCSNAEGEAFYIFLPSKDY